MNPVKRCQKIKEKKTLPRLALPISEGWNCSTQPTAIYRKTLNEVTMIHAEEKHTLVRHGEEYHPLTNDDKKQPDTRYKYKR